MFACYDVKSPAYLEYIPERVEINKKRCVKYYKTNTQEKTLKEGDCRDYPSLMEMNPPQE